MFRIELLDHTIQPVFMGRGKSSGQGTVAEYAPNYGADRAKVESYDRVKGDYKINGTRWDMTFVESLLRTNGPLTWRELKKLTGFGLDQLSDSIALSHKIRRKGGKYLLA
jgi:hypothetical protein